MLRTERQSARMSKITNDGLTRSGTGCLQLYQYGNNGRQSVNIKLANFLDVQFNVLNKLSNILRYFKYFIKLNI